jgi:2-polyprenyl-6-methoxyphenol hydroxylase-like FAD-dependent oxidoreductase
MSPQYDAIIVGARCAGAPTAMLLARKGYRVLLVDRATFPSDTMSTHIIHPPGISALKRWGLLDRLASTGCPPIAGYSFDFGPIRIAGSLRPDDGVATAYCPRRTVLDYLLVEAAVAAGAELRERFTVEEVLIESGHVTGVRGHTAGGATVTERARVVVGADGSIRWSPRPSKRRATTSGQPSRRATTPTGAGCRPRGSRGTSARLGPSGSHPPTTA